MSSLFAALVHATSGFDWPAVTTAISTVVLALFTVALALYTRLLVLVTQQPLVVATIEPNPQALMYVDLHVGNDGNAPAFDVSLSFEPPLPVDKAGNSEGPLPFANITLLRPGQKLSSFVCSFEKVKHQSFVVSVSWRKRPKGQIERISYPLSMSHYEGWSRLGNDWVEKSGKSLEKIASHVEAIASGRSTVIVDTFNPVERARVHPRERRRLRDWRRDQQQAQRQQPTSAAEPSSDDPTQ